MKDKQYKERIMAWKRAGPELERIRMAEIRKADTTRAIIALDGPFQSALLHYKPRLSSGLVEQQRIFSHFYSRRT